MSDFDVGLCPDLLTAIILQGLKSTGLSGIVAELPEVTAWFSGMLVAPY